MSRTVATKIYVTVADADESVRESRDALVREMLFDVLAQFADEELVESVDGWDPA